MSMTTKKPRILIVYTGGTIGMIEDAETHSLRPFDFSHLIDNVPKIQKLDFDIENIQFNPPIDSAKHVAQALDRYCDGYRGAV